MKEFYSIGEFRAMTVPYHRTRSISAVKTRDSN